MPNIRRMVLALAALAAGCGVNTPAYFSPPMGPLVAGGQGQPAESTAIVALPFRPPTADERGRLDAESAELGFAAPWIRRDRVALSIQYTITNLAAEAGRAQILVNGGNELTSYDLQALRMAATDDEAVILSLIQGTPVQIESGASLSGVIREDDFAEAALDLDAIGRWMAPPPAVLINASEVNAVGLERLPAGVVVPALIRVAVTFTASRHMRLDFLVRVRDEDGRLLEGEGDVYAPKARAYMPPAMPRMP